MKIFPGVFPLKVKSYTEHVQCSGLSSGVQERNILTVKMANRKVGSGRIKWWAIVDPALPPKREDGNWITTL